MPSARPGRRHLKIGELERALGVTRDQVHHYIALGLVPPPTKSTATLAWYGPEHAAALKRVRAIRDAGGSLAQAQRWLTGELANLGPMDCATLTRWMVGEAANHPPPLPVEAVVAMLDAGLARVHPDALVGGSALDPAAWLAELGSRWAEREELARVTVAREAVSTAADAALTSWLSIDPERVAGGAMRAAVLDQVAPGADAAADEERARLGVMLPLVTPVARLAGAGAWSVTARAMSAMRARRWSDAAGELATLPAGDAGSTLAAALAWCNDAIAAARAGDHVLEKVLCLGALRSIEADAAADLIERLRVRWTVAVTWLALPRRWGGDRPGRALAAVFDELAQVAPDDPLRATGELAAIEANAGIARTAWRLREGDREGAVEAARQVAVLGGAASREAARLMRRTARSV